VTTTTQASATTTASEGAEQEPARSDFEEEEQLTAELAGMSDTERTNLGYTVNEMVLDCKFAGSTCKPRFLYN